MSEPAINKGFGATRVSLPIIYDKFGYYVCYTNDLQENVGPPASHDACHGFAKQFGPHACHNACHGLQSNLGHTHATGNGLHENVALCMSNPTITKDAGHTLHSQ